MSNKINIVFASDDNYAQHIAVVIASIMAHTKEQIRYFIVNDNISNDKIIKLKRTAEFFKAEIHFINVPEKNFNNVYLSGHVSKAAYFRLALADILPDNIEKVLYLDVDLLVYDDIKILWNTDLEDLPLGAVPDYGIMASSRLCKQKERVIGLPVGEKYFNSGVLVVNLKKWREKKYFSKILEIINNNQFPHHDQDALNKLFMYKWKILDLRWNIIPPVFNLFPKVLFNNIYRKSALEAKKNPGIIHYAGRYKPWEFSEYNGFNDMYYKCLKKTAFADAIMPQPSKNMKGKSITRQIIRLKIADFWKAIL
ncbi:MAG: glycosyltransferase family 8 protein [Phascolarctobacterium sp.]|nr:MAG: glycosyltransferase family 8 protein [Phascolarctobacterium sp.]